VAAWARAWPNQPSPARASRPVAALPVAGGGIVGVLATMALARLAA
jgi:hypothetical protein